MRRDKEKEKGIVLTIRGADKSQGIPSLTVVNSVVFWVVWIHRIACCLVSELFVDGVKVRC